MSVGCGGAFSASGDTSDSGEIAYDAGDGGAADRAAHEAPVDAASSETGAGMDAASEPAASCGDGGACTAAVPAGWPDQKLYELYVGPSSATSPDCDPSFTQPVDLHADLVATDAVCSCACNPGPVACSAPISYRLNGCAGSACASANPVQGQCTFLDPSACNPMVGDVVYATSGTPTPTGSCTPTPSATLPTPAWNTSARACLSQAPQTTAGCNEGLCQPAPSSPFHAKLCIAQHGDVSCPSDGYTEKSTLYGGATEGRSCSACSCGPVTGVTCSGSVDYWSNGTCNLAPQASQTLPFSCVDTTGWHSFQENLTASGTPSCAPSGGQPQGSITPSDAWTFCCQP